MSANNIKIDPSDRIILRELAKKQYAYSQEEKNKKRIFEWTDHNSLCGKRPMIHLELWTFQQEIIPERLKCTGTFARAIEEKLFCNFLNQELFDDDRVTPDHFAITYDTQFTLFGIPVTKHNSSGALGHEFLSVLEDLEEDYHKLKATEFDADGNTALEKQQILKEVFGDILPVRVKMDALYSVPTQMIIHIMKMEHMMYNIYDYPELFLTMMDGIAEDTISYYSMLEQKGLILPTVAGEELGQGSWCYNRELASEEEAAQRNLTTKDVWGFMDSQETVGLSPEMFREFIFPCYEKIACRYGLLSYGCCEPVDPIWENCISGLSNLRKVSISPWCNEEYMGEQLRDRKVIFHRKPSPNYLGVGTSLDEEAVRASIKKTIQAAKGCSLEVTQRDVYTINHDIAKARRYVDLLKSELGID